VRIVPKVASLLSAGALAAGLTVGIPGTAEAFTLPGGGSWAELFNPELPLVNNSFHTCLDVPYASTSESILQMYHCHGYASNGSAQRWDFTSLSDGSYWIWNQNSLMCVTALPSGALGPGRGRIAQEPCGSADGQAWDLVPARIDPANQFQIMSVSGQFSDACLAGSNYDEAQDPESLTWEYCDGDFVEQLWGLG
jgi:hypothetical protein